jgi:hypothetical protein
VGSAHRSVELLAALLSSLLLGIMFGGLAVTLGQDELKGSRKKGWAFLKIKRMGLSTNLQLDS